MITEKDLQEAIAECQGERNPNANTCIKLAAFYTIQQHMFGEEPPGYSLAPSPPPQGADSTEAIIDYNGETEFAQSITGRDAWDIWSIMDELMTTLQVVNPRLYAGVMRKIAE